MSELPITPVYIEKINANDDSYLLAEILFRNGDYVQLNKKIARIETSKTIFEIVSPAAGYIYFNPSLQGNHVPPHFLIAIIHLSNQLAEFEIEDIFDKTIQPAKSNEESEQNNSKFSRKALDLIKEHNLNKEIFKDKSIVREIDIVNYIKKNNSAEK